MATCLSVKSVFTFALRLYTVRSKRSIVILSGCLFTTLLFLQLRYTYSPQNASSYFPSSGISASRNAPFGFPPYATSDNAGFWLHFHAALTEATPRCSLPHYHIDGLHTQLFVPWGPPMERPDKIRMHIDEETELKDAHAWFISQILSDSFPKPYFVPGSAGVVTSAGGTYLPGALVAIRMLRRTGSTLPVEVFFQTPDEIEGDICETALPLLGARCRVVSELMDLMEGGLPRRFNITHFQIKTFAMLLSEFDNILWIDADQIALVDPREFLEGELLRSTGLVTWPDYWAESVSPLFFRIAEVPDHRIPDPPGSRAASESGQLLISKSINLRALELAAYYNFHGPSHYYIIISQGAWGTGDKDTFLAAAMALDAPFWDVKTPVQVMGYTEGGDWNARGILQAHPGLDKARFGNGTNRTGFSFHPGTPDAHFDVEDFYQRVPPAFLHSQQVKPDAGLIIKSWQESAPQRLYRPLEAVVSRFGYDVERAIWDGMVWTACDTALHGHVFKSWVEDLESDSAEPGSLESDSVHSKTAKPDTSESNTVKSEIVKSETLKSETVKSETVGSESVESKPVASERKDVCSQMRGLYRALFEGGDGKSDNTRIGNDAVETHNNETSENDHNEDKQNEDEQVEDEQTEHEQVEYAQVEQEQVEHEQVEHEHIGHEHIEDEHIEDEHIEDEHIEDEHIEDEHIEDEHIEDKLIEGEQVADDYNEDTKAEDEYQITTMPKRSCQHTTILTMNHLHATLASTKL